MKIPFVTVSISCAVCVLYALFGAMPDLLMWHQGEQQQWWQWISSHFVHISTEHLLWNVLALLLLGSIIEHYSIKSVLAALFVGAIGVNIYLALFYALEAYAGLSGVLNTLLVVALYYLYQQPGYKIASLITLVLSVAKVAAEHYLNLSVFSTLPWPSVPQAHFSGLVTGAIMVVCIMWITNAKSAQNGRACGAYNSSNN